MAEYHLLTIWRIEAPLAEVYAAIESSLSWPQWWPSVKDVEDITDGRADGIGSVRRYAWQGKFPYRVVFDVCATRIEPQLTLEGSASGDLEGIGRWSFSSQGGVSTVKYEWHVRSKRWWMNLVAPMARSIFIRNHTRIMEQGGKALARLLKAPLVAQESVDLTAEVIAPEANRACLRDRGRIDLSLVLIAGLAAGVIVTVVQLVLWGLAGIPVLDTLLRDARLTAAIVMGSSILPPPLTLRWDIMLVATLIHFFLSMAYALIPARFARHFDAGPALILGGLYGLGIYVINMYGLTLLFPWFVVARNWTTLVPHLVFGMVLMAACRLYSSRCGFAEMKLSRKLSAASPATCAKP